VAFVRRISCVTHRKCDVGILLTVFRDVTPVHWYKFTNIATESVVFIFKDAVRRSAPFRDICEFIPDCTASHSYGHRHENLKSRNVF